MIDFTKGLFRQFWFPREKLNFSREAVKRYFSTINKEKYYKRHTSLNNDLFIKPIFQQLKDKIESRQLILDLGAGFCDLELLLTSTPIKGVNIIAIDEQLHMLNAGKKSISCAYSMESLKISFLVGDILDCPLQNSCADLVLCINVSPYIESLKKLALEIKRLLKNGQHLVLVQPSKNIFWEEEFEGVKLNFFTNEELIGVFKNIGFDMFEKTLLKFFLFPFLKKPFSIYAVMYVFGLNN